MRPGAAPGLLAGILAVVMVGCPEDVSRDGPMLENATDKTIWVQTVNEGESARSWPVVVDAGSSTQLNEGHPCLESDALVVTDGNPDEPPQDTVLLEHDLQERPLCNHEGWKFDGAGLELVE